MKVVLFCGGYGTRLREYSDTIPKPLVPIGSRPIIWHLMKYYAHHGHKDFILCLGWKGDSLREYFLNYQPNLSRDFSIGPGAATFPTQSDIADWRITFVNTGLHSNIGQRLLRVREYIATDDMFLANYTDQLSDVPLDKYIDMAVNRQAIASFVSVRPSQSFHIVDHTADGTVRRIDAVEKHDLWVNGGFMVFRREFFDYVNEGEELINEPYARLIEIDRLYTYRHEGFWACMDTFKDKVAFDRIYGAGNPPWEKWDDSADTRRQFREGR